MVFGNGNVTNWAIMATKSSRRISPSRRPTPPSRPPPPPPHHYYTPPSKSPRGGHNVRNNVTNEGNDKTLRECNEDDKHFSFKSERRSRTTTNLHHFTIECLGPNKQKSEKGRKIKFETKQSDEYKGARSSTYAKKQKKSGS
ncbi:hypothetical protein YC2023_037915 [Brassica napus]